MKVLLVANYVPDGQQSMQLFANLMEAGLSQAGHEVRVIRPRPWFGSLKPSAMGIGKWLGYLDKFLVFPVELRRSLAWADVVHICDHSNAFYTRHLQGVPHVVTCNDLLAIRSALGEIPENQTAWTGRQLQRLILEGLNHAQRVVCISDQTRDDLLRLSALEPEAAVRVYMGLNYPYAPMTRSTAKHWIERFKIPPNSRFILHVGGNHWYKNKAGVIAIFNALRSRLNQPDDLYLVLAGRAVPPYLQEMIQQYDLEPWGIPAYDVENEE